MKAQDVNGAARFKQDLLEQLQNIQRQLAETKAPCLSTVRHSGRANGYWYHLVPELSLDIFGCFSLRGQEDYDFYRMKGLYWFIWLVFDYL